MKDTDPVNSYSININQKKYEFTCPDGEQHVREIERKIMTTLDAVSGQEPGHILSDFAVKVVLLLADAAISEKKCRDRQLDEIEEKVVPMLRELNRALEPDEQF
jgi:hypothetical protein